MMKKLFILIVIAITPMVVFAMVNNSSVDKHAIFTKAAPAPIGAYSQAIKMGDITYISGQIPIDNKTGELVKGDFSSQFRQAIINLSEITKASGGSLSDIVKVTVYVTDLTNFAIVNKVMTEYFHEPYPARVVVEIKALPKHAAVEIEAVMEKKVEA